MPLKPGTMLGPHEILSLIGAGGMGEVYKARDSRLDRIVAIKVLPAHLAGNPELRERFEREARTSCIVLWKPWSSNLRRGLTVSSTTFSP